MTMSLCHPLWLSTSPLRQSPWALLATHQDTQVHDAVITGVARKGPVWIVLCLIADAHIGVRAFAPMIDREQCLSCLMIMHLHRTVAVRGIGWLVAEIKNIIGGIQIGRAHV